MLLTSCYIKVILVLYWVIFVLLVLYSRDIGLIWALLVLYCSSGVIGVVSALLAIWAS